MRRDRRPAGPAHRLTATLKMPPAAEVGRELTCQRNMPPTRRER